jgi:Mg2+-importing ATPase
MGTSVRSGTAFALIIHTGQATTYGQIAARLALAPPETELERGLRTYGALLMRVMLVVVIIVLAVNMMLARPPVYTLLFAVALAVGLSPELLPAILAITLARGHRKWLNKA